MKCSASKLIKNNTLKMTINISGMKFLEWRMKLGVWIIGLAIKIIGMKSEIEIKQSSERGIPMERVIKDITEQLIRQGYIHRNPSSLHLPLKIVSEGADPDEVQVLIFGKDCARFLQFIPKEISKPIQEDLSCAIECPCEKRGCIKIQKSGKD